jgi:hypothetical protein
MHCGAGKGNEPAIGAGRVITSSVEEFAMQLWTYHPSSFCLDVLALQIKPGRGQYWTHQEKNFRYREIARMLWESVGTNQFLWCCTLRGMFIRPTEEADLVEWEIKAPPAVVIAYISSPVWENLVWSRSDSWDGLFVNDPPMLGHKEIHALVAIPLPPACVKCHGQLTPQYTREHMERAAELVRTPPPVDPKLLAEYDIDALG